MTTTTSTTNTMSAANTMGARRFKHGGLLRLVAAYALLLSAAAAAETEFILPPPPSAQAPEVDMAMLTLLDAQNRPQPALPDFVPAPRKIALHGASASGVTPGATPAEVDAVLESIRSKATMQDTLRQIMISQLREQLPEGGAEVVFDQVVLPGDLELNDDGWMADFEFRLPRSGIGRTTYVARVTDSEGNLLRRFSGSLLLDREVPAIQVTRMMRRGDRVGPGDVRLVTARLSQLPRGVLDQPELAIGTEVQGELRPGSWLSDRSVRRPELVKRNQAVTIELNRGMIHITAPGIAREGGTEGEVIKVANAQSGREVYARVVSPDIVHVLY